MTHILETSQTTFTLSEAAMRGFALANSELAGMITRSDLIGAAERLGLSPDAALAAVLGSAPGFERLASGDGTGALDVALADRGISLGGSESPASRGLESNGGGRFYDDNEAGQGELNYRTAEPGQVVYDDNGRPSGVMTEDGIDLFADTTDENGDGIADSEQYDEDGNEYLFPDGEETEEEIEIHDGHEVDLDEEDEETEEDGSDPDTEEEGSDDEVTPDQGDTSSQSMSGTDGTTQPGGEDTGDGGDASDDFVFKKPGDGTTQPGEGDDESGAGTDLIGTTPGYGLTQPGIDQTSTTAVFIPEDSIAGLINPGPEEINFFSDDFGF